MKKKILYLLTIIILAVSLFLLTACGDSDDKIEKSESKSGAKAVIEDFAKYYNDKDAKKIADLFDIEECKKIMDKDDFTKSDVEDTYEYVFEEYAYLDYKVKKIDEIKSKEDFKKVMEKQEYDYSDDELEEGYDEFEDMKGNNLLYYVDVESNGVEATDIFIISEDDGKYSIVTCATFTSFYSSATLKDIQTNVDVVEKEMFNAAFLVYEGTQKGAQVKVLLSEISSSNLTSEHEISIEYKAGDGDNLEDMSISASDVTEISSLRNRLETTHSYSISFSYDDGYIDEVEIEY